MRIENCLEQTVELEHGIILKDKEYKTFVVREAVGLDEEAMSVPQYRKKPIGMYQELVYRCVAEVAGLDRMITKNEFKTLPVGSIDSLMVAIRILSSGEVYDFTERCPKKDGDRNGDNKCAGKVEGQFDLRTIEYRSGKRTFDLELKRGVMRGGKRLTNFTLEILNGFGQETLSNYLSNEQERGKFGELRSKTVQAIVKDIGGTGNITEDEVKNLSGVDRKKLIDAIEKSPGPSLTLDCECPICGMEFKHTINVMDFLA